MQASGRWMRTADGIVVLGVDTPPGDLGLPLPRSAIHRVHELAALGAGPREAMEQLSAEYEFGNEAEIWDSLKAAWPRIKQGAKALGIAGRIWGLAHEPPPEPIVIPEPPPVVVVESDAERRRRQRRGREM